MARLWDVNKDADARARGADEPNVKALQDAVDKAPKWAVDDVLVELGGTGRDATHRLAEKMLEASGKNIKVSSQMRNIDRWLAYERGETGKQVRKPDAASQKILNRIGRNAQAARDGFDIAMKGDVKVSGYRRSNRSANIHMEGQAALDFLENPSYEALGEAYNGSSDFGGYGTIEIDVQL